MIRGLAVILTLALCSAALCGCVDLPFVVSTGPYYKLGDPGVTLDGLDRGFWINDQKQQLRFQADSDTKQPGDYILTFTDFALPEPTPDGDNSAVPRDASKPSNNDMLQGHIFDIDGQLYMDVAILQPLAEPLPDLPLNRSNGREDHVLLKFSAGLGQFTLQYIDAQWWTGMAPFLSEDISFVYPEPMPDKATVPVMRDTPERLTAFVKKFSKQLTWSPAVVFKKGQ